MPSREKDKTASTANVPNKRERASAQYGQLDDLTATNWNADTPPTTIQEAIERIAAALTALTQKP